SQAGGAALRVSWPCWSGRHCRRQPWLWALPTPVGAAPTSAGHAHGRSRMLVATPARGFGHGRPPPCRGPWTQPAAPCSRLGCGWPALHGVGRPSSLLPSLRKCRKNE
ncbi:hypothetical protein B296_00044180, partial [Ensete ventricosum]